MKKFLVILVLISILLCITSCGTKYEDTNGADNFALQTITDDEILGNHSASSSGGVEYTRNWITYKSCDQLDGVIDIDEFGSVINGNHQEIHIYSFQVEKGNVKLVLCDFDKIVKVFDVSNTEQIFSFDTTDNYYYLRIAGEDCTYSIEYQCILID